MPKHIPMEENMLRNDQPGFTRKLREVAGFTRKLRELVDGEVNVSTRIPGGRVHESNDKRK